MARGDGYELPETCDSYEKFDHLRRWLCGDNGMLPVLEGNREHHGRLGVAWCVWNYGGDDVPSDGGAECRSDQQWSIGAAVVGECAEWRQRSSYRRLDFDHVSVDGNRAERVLLDGSRASAPHHGGPSRVRQRWGNVGCDRRSERWHEWPRRRYERASRHPRK